MLRRLNLAADRVQNHLYGMQREIEQLSPCAIVLNQRPELFARPDAASRHPRRLASVARRLADRAELEEMGRVCKAGLARLAELQSRLADISRAHLRAAGSCTFLLTSKGRGRGV